MKEKREKKISEERLKAEARSISIKEASAYSVSEGFGIRFITPFALALGANNSQIGFLSAFPSLFGNFSQLFSSRLMEKYSRQKIVFFSILIQALMWIPLIFISILFFVFNLSSGTSANLLILIYTLLILAGAFAGPAWSSWMKELIEKNSGKYFGRRNRIAGFISIVSMLIAGFILDYFKNTKLFIGFVILFFVAFVFRSISAFLFLRQYEPKLKLEKGYYFSFFQFIKRVFHTNFGRFTIFISLISFSTAIAGPFFAVYVLRNLGFSYSKWTALILANSFASILLMSIWGKFADKYGNLKSMKISGIFVFLIPFLWLLIPFINFGNLLFPYLIILESFAGAVWAGFNLSASNFIYDAVTRGRMALCVSYFNIINGIGAFIGAILGGFISSLDFVFLGLNSLLFIFLLSGILRLIVYFYVLKIKEVREVDNFGIKEIKKRMYVDGIKRVFDFGLMRPKHEAQP